MRPHHLDTIQALRAANLCRVATHSQEGYAQLAHTKPCPRLRLEPPSHHCRARKQPHTHAVAGRCCCCCAFLCALCELCRFSAEPHAVAGRCCCCCAFLRALCELCRFSAEPRRAGRAGRDAEASMSNTHAAAQSRNDSTITENTHRSLMHSRSRTLTLLRGHAMTTQSQRTPTCRCGQSQPHPHAVASCCYSCCCAFLASRWRTVAAAP